MSDLFVDAWGAGTPVVLVHGSLATGAEEWAAQRPLADAGFRLLVRPFFEADLPLAELASGRFPKLVVSGGHSAGFDAICDDLAQRIGATRTVVSGAGHEIQFTGPPINEALLARWRTAASASGHGSASLG